jgi:hypothetical protein
MSTVSTDPVIISLVTAQKGVKLVGRDHIVSKVFKLFAPLDMKQDGEV